MTTTSASRSTATTQDLTVVRRDGRSAAFDAGKIGVALSKAFLAVEGADAGASHRVRDLVATLTGQVVEALGKRAAGRPSVQVEEIQDQVELALMRAGEHQVARAYVLYREERAKARVPADAGELDTAAPIVITVRAIDGSTAPLDLDRLRVIIAEAAAGLDSVDPELILNETLGSCYNGIALHEVEQALVMAARSFVETEPEYSFAASRLLLDQIRRETLGRVHGEPRQASQAEMATAYVEYFPKYVDAGIEAGLLDPELATFDLGRLAEAIRPERDLQFAFLGLQTLYDRYLLHIDKVRFELPQAFFLRVAMGMALREDDREARAIEFYELLSSFRFMSSTPTLFNSGTTRPQLSSCFLTTVDDDLSSIFSSIRNNALLAKYSGGLGNDWTPVRGIGAKIKGTNGESQGVVPFLKIANDTAVAVNQCFAPETLVYAGAGSIAIRDIKVGDLVLGASGRYREVTKTFTYDQDDPMVEVDAKHSIEPLTVTAGHPLYAIQGVPLEQSNERTFEWLAKGKVQAAWVEAGMLSRGDYLGQVVPKEIIPVHDLTEDDARLYGILLGDGHLSKNGSQWGYRATHSATRTCRSYATTSPLAISTSGRMGAVTPTCRSTGRPDVAPEETCERDVSSDQARRHFRLSARTSTTNKARSTLHGGSLIYRPHRPMRSSAASWKRTAGYRVAPRSTSRLLRESSPPTCATSCFGSGFPSRANTASGTIRTSVDGPTDLTLPSRSPYTSSISEFPPYRESPSSWASRRSGSSTGSHTKAWSSPGCARSGLHRRCQSCTTLRSTWMSPI